MSKIKIHVCSNELESWDTIWKWKWFTRDVWENVYWKEEQATLRPLFPLLHKLNIKSILDCSCGLGFKTILFAKRGFEVEGSDGSPNAIKYAPQLAKEKRVKIRFFLSRYEELGEKCKRKYDCVFSDNFDEIETYKYMKVAAKNIHSILNNDGKLIFSALPPHFSRKDLKKVIEKEWRKRKRFDVDAPYEKDGIRVTRIEVNEKTSEGILENNIFLIEEHGVLRVEIASIMNPRIKWTWKDYYKVLKEAGFSEVYSTKENFAVAIK